MMSTAVNVTSPSQLQVALRSRTMALNAAWNVIGQAVPLLVAAVTIPLLIKRLGVDRFGVLTLAWALVGYFSLFDLGVGRALTKSVSDKLACGKESELPSAIWSGLGMMIGLGVFFGLLIWLNAHWIVTSIMRVPSSLAGETLRAMYPLALCIPVITTSTALRGVLEAQHRFGITNSVRVAMGIFNFVGPLVTAFVVASIYPILIVLVVGRLVTALIFLHLCLRHTPQLRSAFQVRRVHCRELLSTGMWMSVSNVVGPVMVYLDRFLISAILSVALVAYYTTPFEVVTKLWIVPVAVTSVLFPAFAALFATDLPRLNDTYMRGLRSTFVLLFPGVFLIVLFAPEALRVWLGPVFQQLSTPVLRWITVGVFVNSIGQVPYGLLQAANRADITAKIHLCELPIYLGTMAVAVHFFGLTGAAIAWALRLSVETMVLLWFSQRLVVCQARQVRFVVALGLGLAALLIASIPMPVLSKLLIAATVLTTFVALSWRSLLQQEERLFLKSRLLSAR